MTQERRRRDVGAQPAPDPAEPEPLSFDPETAVTIGRIVAAHGLHGELKVESLTDLAERFDAGAIVWLQAAPIRIERARRHGRALYLKLAGIDDRNQAEAIRGRELQAARIEDLGRDTYYRDDLIGLDVVDEQGQTLGTVADIFATGSNDVYVVRGPRGELLLPATDDVIKEVDLPGHRLTVEVIEGLEWEPRKPRRSARRRSPRAG